jgi:hypothetical protein
VREGGEYIKKEREKGNKKTPRGSGVFFFPSCIYILENAVIYSLRGRRVG